MKQPRSRTIQAITDVGSAYRGPRPHRRWRVTKKREARYLREYALAWKWLHGRHNWFLAAIEAARLAEMFGCREDRQKLTAEGLPIQETTQPASGQERGQ